MEINFLKQYLIVSTFKKAMEINDVSLLDKILKKDYLKVRIPDENLGYFAYSDALIALVNIADENEKKLLYDKIMNTTDKDIIENIKKNPPLAEYIMTFLNYLYFSIYFGTEKLEHPKKIKVYIRNEKAEEIKKFRNNIISTLGETDPISYKVNRIYEIVLDFNYKDIEEFEKQVYKISEYIDRIFKNLLDREAYPISFIFKHVYLPYLGLIYRVNGNKDSEQAENYRFLAHKTLLALSSYNNLNDILSKFTFIETDFSYLHNLINKEYIKTKVGNLNELARLLCLILIEVADDKLSDENKQLIYLFYKDVETLIWEYTNLIEYLM